MSNYYIKISKKHLDRSFSMGMILEYCIKHANYHNGPFIISMVNLFLRNSEDVSQEERDSVDRVEYLLLHPEKSDVCFFEELFDVHHSGTSDGSSSMNECFKFPSEFMKQKMAAVLNEYYQGSHANLALIEIALFDHGQLRKRNNHTAFLKSLVDWGLLKFANDDAMKQALKGIIDKYRRLPKVGYEAWDDHLLNERKICANIGILLGNTMPYIR